MYSLPAPHRPERRTCSQILCIFLSRRLLKKPYGITFLFELLVPLKGNS